MVISLKNLNKEDISNRSLPPKNPRYNHVRSTLDTGFHAGNAAKKKNIRKKNGEAFSRLKGSELYTVITDYRPQTHETIYSLQENTSPTYATHENLTETEIEIQRPYVLLDIRHEISDYQMYNIESSIHFPSYMFRQDKMPHEIYSVRRIPDHAIIVCSNNEEEGIATATTLVHKNCKNVYLLANSIERFLSRYPDTARGNNPPEAAPPKARIWNPKKLKQRYLNGGRSHRSTTSINTTMSTRSWLP